MLVRSTLGVSRFRMNDINHVPKTAQSITLTPISKPYQYIVQEPR